MEVQKVKLIFEIIASGVTTLAIIAGGIWAYFRFVRQRENSALIDFSVDIKFISKKNNWWVVEVLAYIENRGKVQHRIKEFTFDLSSLDVENSVETSSRYNNQVYFPNDVAEGSFLPNNCSFFFIEPGLKNKYTYVARIPLTADLLILHSSFKYLNSKHFHTAEVTLKVPKEADTMS